MPFERKKKKKRKKKTIINFFFVNHTEKEYLYFRNVFASQCTLTRKINTTTNLKFYQHNEGKKNVSHGSFENNCLYHLKHKKTNKNNVWIGNKQSGNS